MGGSPQRRDSTRHSTRRRRWKKLGQHEIVDKMIKKLLVVRIEMGEVNNIFHGGLMSNHKFGSCYNFYCTRVVPASDKIIFKIIFLLRHNLFLNNKKDKKLII